MLLKEQTYILTLAKFRNITKAANELHLTQPALSTFLSNLESSIGLPLFKRDKKPMELTDAGNLYVEKARKMMAIKAEFDLELSKLITDHTSHLSIGIQTIRGPHTIPAISSAMKEACPHISLSFHEGNGADLDQMMEHQEIDIMLSTKYTPHVNLEYVTLHEDELVIAMSEDHPLFDVLKIGPDGLMSAPLSMFADSPVLLQSRSSSISAAVMRMFKALDFTPESTQTFKRADTILNLAASNQGIGFIFKSYIPLFQLPDHLVFCHIENWQEPLEFIAAYDPSRFTRKDLSKILKTIQSAC